jgi:hypothetical protein
MDVTGTTGYSHSATVEYTVGSGTYINIQSIVISPGNKYFSFLIFSDDSVLGFDDKVIFA